METADSEFLKHVPCPNCGSSDAGGLYSDGHVHCFSCGKTAWTDSKPEATTKRQSMTDFLTGDCRAVTARGLSEATCRKYGYRIGEDRKGRPCQIADYRDADGTLVAQKIRYADKTFSVVGLGGNKMPLFGQNLWQAGGKRLVITEGEIDAMSVAQAMNLSWPAVSVPNGAQAAKKAIQNAYEYVSSFEEVVFMFDMDEVGRAAVAECVVLLPPGKAKIAEMPRKDANEMLKAGEVKQLVSAVYQARVYRPDGIVTLDEIEERVLSTATMGAPFPFEGVTKATFGRQIGDVVGLGAGTGVGKTDLFTQIIANDVMNLGKTCGVLYLEQGVGETGRRIAGKTAGKPFHAPDGSWTQAELKAAWGALKATQRLHLYDSFGAMDWPTIKSKILYMIHSLGCEHIFLDHLTALAAAADDERTALEGIMAEIAGIANGRCVFHYVSHLSTPDGKPHEEGGRVSIRHFKGSRAIGFWSHQLYGLERNQQADTEEERSKTYLRCLKDRLTGRGTGKVWELQYDPATGLLAEVGEVMKVKDEAGDTDF